MSKLEIKPCCDRMKDGQELLYVDPYDRSIDICAGDFDDEPIGDIKYCPFCGKELIIAETKPVPLGYVIATGEQKEKYEKPRDYLFRHKSGGTTWQKGPSLDGKWCLGEYAVRVDHVWRSREDVRDACLECGEDVTVGKTWTTCTVCKYAITTHAYRQGVDND